MKLIESPINEVHVSQLFKTSIDNLTKMEAITEKPTLYYCKNILFSLCELETEELNKIFQGQWYLQTLTYAKCDSKISKWNKYSISSPENGINISNL